MEADIAEQFLKILSGFIRREKKDVPEILELPTVEPFGLMIGREKGEQVLSDPEHPYVLYRDGLALLGSRIQWGEYFFWTPRGE